MGEKIKRQNGFTLIELMVVIVIIGILVAIALPNFVGAQDRAKISSIKSNAHTLQVTVETYAVDWGGNYPNSIPAIENQDGYKIFQNPITGFEGAANVSGQGAWRTNDDGQASGSDTALLNSYGEATQSKGLAIYVGLNSQQNATTLFLSATGAGAGSDLTTGYMIYACDKTGNPIRRFLLSNGNPPPAGARLLQGS